MYTKLALTLCVLGTLVLVGTSAALFWEDEEKASSEDGSGSARPDTTQTPEPGEPSDGADGEKEVADSGEAPSYETLRERETEGIRELDIKTGATRASQMRLIAEDLRSHAPQDGILLLEFRRETGTDALEETGFALVFDSREAAAAPYLSYTEEEREAIFSEDGGIRIVSYEEL